MSDALRPLLGALALGVTGAALISAVLTLAVTRRPGLALGVLLDLLVAAGLLRLTGDPDWQVIATAAAVVALRRLIGVGLRAGSRGRSAGRAGRTGRHRGWRVPVGRLVRPAWRA